MKALRAPVWPLSFVAALALDSRAAAGEGDTQHRAAGSSPQTHDGFYLRLASGFGAYDEAAWSGKYDNVGKVNARARGFAVTGEVAVGTTPWTGLVIGLGVYTSQVYTSSVTFKRDVPPPEEIGIESRDFNLFGVFVDRYFVPTLGVHAQAALGVATQLELGIDPFDPKENRYTAFGPGILLGFGYETWIGEQWSLGALARMDFSTLFGRQSGVRWVHVVMNTPTFLMTVTNH